MGIVGTTTTKPQIFKISLSLKGLPTTWKGCPLSWIWDLLLAPSLPLRHSVFSCQASLPSSTLLIHYLWAHHPTATTLRKSWGFAGAKCQGIVWSLSCCIWDWVFTTPTFPWFSSPTKGTIPSSPPFEDLLLQKTTECCFPGFLPSFLFMLYTSSHCIHFEVLAVFNIYTCNSDLWARF